MNDSEDEEDTKKKVKNKKEKEKKNYLRMERNYIVNKMTKMAKPYYHQVDPTTGLSKFK